jgi:hypothetical protein
LTNNGPDPWFGDFASAAFEFPKRVGGALDDLVPLVLRLKVRGVNGARTLGITALQANAKIIVPSDKDLVNVIGEMAGLVPLKKS